MDEIIPHDCWTIVIMFLESRELMNLLMIEKKFRNFVLTSPNPSYCKNISFYSKIERLRKSSSVSASLRYVYELTVDNVHTNDFTLLFKMFPNIEDFTSTTFTSSSRPVIRNLQKVKYLQLGNFKNHVEKIVVKDCPLLGYFSCNSFENNSSSDSSDSSDSSIASDDEEIEMEEEEEEEEEGDEEEEEDIYFDEQITNEEDHDEQQQQQQQQEEEEEEEDQIIVEDDEQEEEEEISDDESLYEYPLILTNLPKLHFLEVDGFYIKEEILHPGLIDYTYKEDSTFHQDVFSQLKFSNNVHSFNQKSCFVFKLKYLFLSFENAILKINEIVEIGGLLKLENLNIVGLLETDASPIYPKGTLILHDLPELENLEVKNFKIGDITNLENLWSFWGKSVEFQCPRIHGMKNLVFFDLKGESGIDFKWRLKEVSNNPKLEYIYLQDYCCSMEISDLPSLKLLDTKGVNIELKGVFPKLPTECCPSLKKQGTGGRELIEFLEEKKEEEEEGLLIFRKEISEILRNKEELSRIIKSIRKEIKKIERGRENQEFD